MSDSESTRDFIRRLEQCTRSSTDEMDQRYRERLCRLVAREMNRRYRRREDPEDIVQSVFRSFFVDLKDSQRTFDHTGALWEWLTKATRHKILRRVEFHEAKKRTLDRETCLDPNGLFSQGPSDVEARHLGDALEIVLAGEESLYAEIFQLQLAGYTLAELVEIVLDNLKPPYPEILQLRLQGEKIADIAARLNLKTWQVKDALKRITDRLRRLLGRLDSTD
ncbi:MAG: sigma-70 family RNA polymerase sigma factor [Pirellulales bacterium]